MQDKVKMFAEIKEIYRDDQEFHWDENVLGFKLEGLQTVIFAAKEANLWIKHIQGQHNPDSFGIIFLPKILHGQLVWYILCPDIQSLLQMTEELAAFLLTAHAEFNHDFRPDATIPFQGILGFVA